MCVSWPVEVGTGAYGSVGGPKHGLAVAKCEVYKAENCETKEIVAIKAARGSPKPLFSPLSMLSESGLAPFKVL